MLKNIAIVVCIIVICGLSYAIRKQNETSNSTRFGDTFFALSDGAKDLKPDEKRMRIEFLKEKEEFFQKISTSKAKYHMVFSHGTSQGNEFGSYKELNDLAAQSGKTLVVISCRGTAATNVWYSRWVASGRRDPLAERYALRHLSTKEKFFRDSRWPNLLFLAPDDHVLVSDGRMRWVSTFLWRQDFKRDL